MKKIVHFGDFNKNSYENLLLPLIAKQELNQLANFNLETVSPADEAPGNLTDIISSIGVLDSLGESEVVNGVLISGNDILRTFSAYNKAKLSTGIECSAYSDLWVGPAFFYPQHVPIVWNALSVPEPFSKAQYELVKSVLMRTNYLSVRDNLSKQYLLNVWSDADITVVPNSLWGVSKVWSKAELQSAYQALCERLNIQVPNRTIILHFNQHDLEQYTISGFAQYLDDIAQQLSAQPILMTFNFCHNDAALMQKVAAMMSSCPMILSSPQSLREMTACIAFAYMYVGSSMQGSLIASAFGIPGVAITKHSIVKSVNGAEDWSQVKNIVKAIDIEKYQSELNVLQEKAHRSLDEHWNHIRLELKKRQAYSNEVATFSWRRMIDYQDKMTSTIIEVTKEQLQAIRVEEIIILAGQRNALAKQVRRMENSLSWRMTRPLRVLAKKFPLLKLMVLKLLKMLLLCYRQILRSNMDPKLASIEWQAPHDLVQQITAYQHAALSKKKKIVFYTAIFGCYDSLFLPESISADIDYVCFTDRPQNTYGVWQIKASPFYHSDPVRIARYIKTHPHQLFPEHEIAIWLDANVILRVDVQKYIKMLSNDNVSLGFIPHPKRDCFYQEANECKRLQKDDSNTIDKQVAFYRKVDLKEHAGLFETNFMIIRLTNDAVRVLFRLWWQQIQTFSRRDQLGLAWAFYQNPVPFVNLLPKGISVREHVDFHYYDHQLSRQFYLSPKLKKLGQLKDPFNDIPFIAIKEERLSRIAKKAIDIIVCVYNALEDVQLCLQSARQYLLPEHKIIIVNDQSEQETTEYLRKFAANDRQVILIENEVNLGYVQSANRGLSTATADFCILLNSDTIVCENWALKMLDVAMQDPEIGVVSPLSNAAGVQSLPDIKSGKNNTAINCIPEGVSLTDIDCFLEKVSLANTVPRVLLAHGFCFGIKRELMNSIWLFDIVNFERYYGEENDYCFRASAAGFCSAIVTNTFVYHRKSRSIVEEERIIHMKEAGQKLRQIYGVEAIRAACLQGENHPLLQRMRSRVENFYKSAPKRKR